MAMPSEHMNSDLLEPPDFEAAWAAIKIRDRGSDGRFVFGVVTTGIYCRPSCSARRPLRRNVRLFGRPDEAEVAGFRACLRCDPRAERHDPARRLAEAAREHLEDHLDETVRLSDLAEAVGSSRWHLQRTFKRVFGLTPQGYVNWRRLERVRRSLRTEKSVTDAVYEAGFTSASQLYSQSDRRLGMTPGEWREGGKGAHVLFATAESALGRILVAATSRGVCSVLLGDDDRELEAELQRELPHASLERADEQLRSWLDEVLRRVSGDDKAEALPIDTPATEFQLRVWDALTRIPRGETRSYSEVAALVGQPTAARAVARACAANRVALVVPCHRVVKASGSSGGYRWGADRKSRLLAEERSNEERPTPAKSTSDD